MLLPFIILLFCEQWVLAPRMVEIVSVWRVWLTCILAAVLSFSRAIELTFELPDNANQCFWEQINEGTESTLEFQVVTGGQYDVDMQLETPDGQTLYKAVKKQYDSHTWKASQKGAYKVCFSNEFSTFSHKIVYMDWQVGDEKPLIAGPQLEQHITAMTMIETSAQHIHEKLKVIDDFQTHHRLREGTGRQFAEDLNERVFWWSVGQTVVVVLIGVGQVLTGYKRV